YTLFNGQIDDYEVNAAASDRCVNLRAVDVMQRLADVTIHTGLVPSARTGDAVRVILEAAGIYATPGEEHEEGYDGLTRFDPYVEHGATVMRWWVHSGDALSGLNDLVKAEGPPSFISTGISGQVIFRDRLHRQRIDYPIQPFMYVTGCGGGGIEVREDSSIEYGQRDIINKMEVSYSEPAISPDYTDVWSANGDTTWTPTTDPDTMTYTFTGTVDGGFYDAQVPVKGELQFIENPGPDETDVLSGILPEEHDYVQVEGTIEVDEESLTRSGTEVSVSFIQTEGAFETATIRDVKLRARGIDENTKTATRQDDRSIAKYNGVKSSTHEMGRSTGNDADAVGHLVVTRRAHRRPTAELVFVNTDEETTRKLLSVDMSAVIHVDVAARGVDDRTRGEDT